MIIFGKMINIDFLKIISLTSALFSIFAHLKKKIKFLRLRVIFSYNWNYLLMSAQLISERTDAHWFNDLIDF